MSGACCALWAPTVQGTEGKAPASWGGEQAEFPVEDTYIERGERGGNHRGRAVDRCRQGSGLGSCLLGPTLSW